MDNKETYDVLKARAAQDELCGEEGLPHFAPESGQCWSCRRNIYKPVGWKREGCRKIEVPADSPEADFITGISIDEAGSELVTGCPHCNRSYCD